MSDDLDREVPRIKNLAELEGKHGILLRHVKQIQKYNRRLHWLIMLRPINRDVAGKLHAGSRGKIISIKGKSSEFIFLAGDIPFEAGLSKLGNKGEDSDWGKIEHFNSVNRKSIEGQNEKSINEQKKRINEFRNKIAEFSNKNEDFPVEIEDFSKNIEAFSKKIKIQAEIEIIRAKIEIIRAKIQFAQKKRDSLSENLLLEFKQQLKNKTLEYNLNFNLNKIPKIVEIGGKKYESFYALDKNGHTKYENYKGKQQPIVYVREVGDKTDNYSKIKYDDSEIGYSIDDGATTQKETNGQSIKPIEIFSYEQYEECAITNKKVRINNKAEEKYKIKGSYEDSEHPGQFYVDIVEGEIHKYYPLKKGSVAQDGTDTYEIDLKTEYTGDNSKLEKIEESTEDGFIKIRQRIRIDNTAKEEYEIDGYCTFDDQPGKIYVKAKKENDDDFKYYLLEEPTNLAGQDVIDTYKIDLAKQYNGTEVAKYLEITNELINPPLTADYDQLSAAKVYDEKIALTTIEGKLVKVNYINDDNKEFEIESCYYKDNNNPKQFYLEVKKDNVSKYYPLTSTAKELENVEFITYELDFKSENIKDNAIGLTKLEIDRTKIVKYILEEQEKLISFPPNKYLEECKKAAIRLSTGEYVSMDYDIRGIKNIKTDNLNKDIKNKLKDLKSIINDIKKPRNTPGINDSSLNENIINKCKELMESKSFNNLDKAQINTITRLSAAPYNKYNDDIKLLSEISKEIAEATDYDTIAQESDILQLKLGLLGCCGESVTKEKLELGEILGYGISHGLEMLHYPPEPIKSSILDELLGNENNKDEEFLVVDGEGNPRIAKNLEGVLFFMNDQRKKGLCCLEPNPLWPIKVNFNRSPHTIEVDDMMDSPLLTGGFYTGVLELQKKLGTDSFVDEFIYAERLFLNSDFVPNIKLPNEDIRKNIRKDIRKQIEIANLRRANDHYASVLYNLNNLKKKAEEQGYNKPFLEFCQQQNLSEYIETKDEIIDIFDLKNKTDSEKIKNSKRKTKDFLSNPDNVKKLITSFKDQGNQLLNKGSSNENISDDGLDPTIKEHLEKILSDEKIRTMLLSEPDNPGLKAKYFDTLPNIGLLKGFEIKQKADFLQMDFMEHLDDYIGLVKGRQIQTMDRLNAMGQSIDYKKLNYLKNNGSPNRLLKHQKYTKNSIKALEELKQNKTDKEIDSINKKIEFLTNKQKKIGPKELHTNTNPNSVVTNTKGSLNSTNYRDSQNPKKPWEKKISELGIVPIPVKPVVGQTYAQTWVKREFKKQQTNIGTTNYNKRSRF